MRLVSAYYSDHYPFAGFGLFNELIATSDPNDLIPGDVLLVWGGADIYPGLYSKPASKQSMAGHRPSTRDQIEWSMMRRAKELGIPIIGICRGAQMLCALEGGYLIQHVTGHGGSHIVETFDGKKFKVNSLHHQMMVPRQASGEPINHQIVAQIPRDELRSTVYVDGHEEVDHDQEPEFIYFPDVRGFAIQWHPEMMAENAEATQYIKEFIHERLAA